MKRAVVTETRIKFEIKKEREMVTELVRIMNQIFIGSRGGKGHKQRCGRGSLQEEMACQHVPG